MSTSLVAVGNWTQYIQDFVKGKEIASYKINGPDPLVGCLKDFKATYRCGASTNDKTINIPGEAGGKIALFDCTSENKKCKGLRLTLGDDGNLSLTDSENKQIWASNTNKTGLVLDEFSAKKSKYGRNYLLAGEMLNLGEFIGSPSGNCYLIMDKTSEGNGLQLKYTVLNCDESQQGNDEMSNGLFSLTKSAFNELIGTKNKIKPKMEKLNKNILSEETLFSNKTSKFKADTHNYMGIRNARTSVKKHITQLDAMDEDSDLFLTRYKYRRIAWSILVILIVLGSLKIAHSNS
jgi:hypothetical protein